MFEKVNPSHPDKIADRIAGAIVDLAYAKSENPHIAVEVLLGHGKCFIILESDVLINRGDINSAVKRIAGKIEAENIITVYADQDENLNNNQQGKARCGDNGIFKPTSINKEEQELTNLAALIYEKYPSDGKYLIDNQGIITICQSNAKAKELYESINALHNKKRVKINPLGSWSGGSDVDSGATNRKLGSDMGSGCSGGGLHGKDLSKADVTLNICAMLDKKEYSCSIGDEEINGKKYEEYVKRAKEYIDRIGGFEKLAEWGLIRPKEIYPGYNK